MLLEYEVLMWKLMELYLITTILPLNQVFMKLVTAKVGVVQFRGFVYKNLSWIIGLSMVRIEF